MLILLSLILTRLPALSQTNPSLIQIGETEVRVGMPITQAVSELSARKFRIQPEAADGKLALRAWWVWGPPAGDWAHTFATFYTKGNIIVGVENRTSAGGTLHEVFNALHDAASKITNEGGNPCRLKPSTDTLSNGFVEGIHLDCAGLRISVVRVAYTDTEGNLQIVYEVWEATGITRTRHSGER